MYLRSSQVDQLENRSLASIQKITERNNDYVFKIISSTSARTEVSSKGSG